MKLATVRLARIISLLVGFLSFYILSSPVLADLTITDISPKVINSAEDIITISASASGLTNTTQYLQVGFSKEGETVDYLGYSKNQGGNWYLYKSSPTTSDLSSYFYSFTPVNGAWTGNLEAKVDINDSGFKGTGNYFLKLFKYITSSAQTSKPFTVSVNIAQSVTSQETPSTTVGSSIDWSTVNEANLGASFKVSISLKNFSSDTEYYLKVRGGTSESELNKAQTQSGSLWLSDSDSWSKFPLITTDESGAWRGEIYARVAGDKPEGDYLLKVRVRERDKSTNYDSDSKSVKFIKTVASSDSEQKSKVLDSEGKQITQKSNKKSSVLGTEAATATASTPQATVNLGVFTATPAAQLNTEEPQDQGVAEESFFQRLLPLLGLALIGMGMVVILKYRRDSPH